MQTITIRAHVGQDGVLKLEVPVGLADADIEVVVVVQPLRPHQTDGGESGQTQAPAWPAGFFEETYGAFADEPFTRGAGRFRGNYFV